MAPEVLCRQNHGMPVDYFAMGVIAYECMLGGRPWTGYDKSGLKEDILKKQVEIKGDGLPRGWSRQAANFINKLIQRKPSHRLGMSGPQELKDDEWFKDFNWDALYKKRLTSPLIQYKFT